MTQALSRQAIAELDRTDDPLAAVLAMCEQGRSALVRAASVTEAKEILSAISTLEHAVKVRDMNQEAVVAASTLRIRAERRVGELLAEQNIKPGPRELLPSGEQLPTLEEQGISHNESSKFQRLAAAPAAKFERAVDKVVQHAEATGSAVTREAVMREIAPKSIETPADAWKDGDRFKSACDRVGQLKELAVKAIRFGHFPGSEESDLITTATLLSLRTAREAINEVERTLLQRRRTK
jgi:hypothetical protein